MSAGKHPIYQLTPNGVQNATTDPATIRGWWTKRPEANIGIRTGELSGFIVVDIDPRHGGDVSLEGLVAQHGELPETVTALTGGGGQHYLFRWPGYQVRNHSGKGAIWPGIDIKGDDGYIVVEPSIHISGRIYAWEVSSGPDDVPIAEEPEWLLQAIKDRKPKKVANPPPPTTEVDDGRVERCLANLMRIRVGDNEADGYKRLLVVACRCVEHNLTDDQAVQLVRNYEHEHPFPKQYSANEIIQRIRDAEKTQERGKPSPRTTINPTVAGRVAWHSGVVRSGMPAVATEWAGHTGQSDSGHGGIPHRAGRFGAVLRGGVRGQ